MYPISIDGLSKTYRIKRRKKILALDSLTFQVVSGEVFGFLGPNGAGKSTTIKTLVGQIRADKGAASLFGIPVADPSARKRIGYLPENPALYDFLTAREYLALVGRTFNMDETFIMTESDRVLELLDLRDAERRPIRGFSKGMVQRLGLAQTLLHDPDLYILDEPMSGLDPLGRALVKEIIVDLKKRGKTVFFSTHVTADVEAVCDRVAVIVGGKLQTVSIVSELLEQGIDGYSVQLSRGSGKIFDEFEPVKLPSGLCKVLVRRDEFNRFMALVASDSCEIMLIEPWRRDLEQFFLDIVQRATE